MPKNKRLCGRNLVLLLTFNYGVAYAGDAYQPYRVASVSAEPYFIRRRWDYFVLHLLGAEPPRGYEVDYEH